MAAYNYLQLVNQVLRRLREGEVSSVQDSAYSKLIGDFVNDAKRQTEDAFDWNALTETITADTTSDIFSYVLTGTGQRFRVIEVLNDTDNFVMTNQPSTEMTRLYLLTPGDTGSPRYYNFNGTNSNGDTLVDLYPKPNGTYSLRFNLVKPQLPLSADSDVLLIPSEPVIFGAVARAMAERGEDGGIASAEMYQLYKQSLGDAIALESGRYIEESQWMAR